MSVLTFIIKALEKGVVFGYAGAHRQCGAVFYRRLWLKKNGEEVYLCYNNSGSAATKASRANLEWILREVFKTEPEQFLLDNITYVQFKKIDNLYNSEYSRLALRMNSTEE